MAHPYTNEMKLLCLFVLFQFFVVVAINITITKEATESNANSHHYRHHRPTASLSHSTIQTVNTFANSCENVERTSYTLYASIYTYRFIHRWLPFIFELQFAVLRDKLKCVLCVCSVCACEFHLRHFIRPPFPSCVHVNVFEFEEIERGNENNCSVDTLFRIIIVCVLLNVLHLYIF